MSVSATLFVEFRIERVEVARVKVLLRDAEGFAKPLEMHDLACPQESDRITDIRILD